MKTISCPPAHCIPEGVEFVNCECVRDEKIKSIGKDRKDGAEK